MTERPSAAVPYIFIYLALYLVTHLPTRLLPDARMSALTLMTGMLLLVSGLLSCDCSPALGVVEGVEQGRSPPQQPQQQQPPPDSKQADTGAAAAAAAGAGTGAAGVGAGAGAGAGSEGGEALCPSCALAQVQREQAETAAPQQQVDMVEAVKRHILNMLHLSTRPNITRPVPRAALLNAIRKLHVGRVGEDGSVEMEDDAAGLGHSQGGMGDEQPAEIITFAEPGKFGTLCMCLCECECECVLAYVSVTERDRVCLYVLQGCMTVKGTVPGT